MKTKTAARAAALAAAVLAAAALPALGHGTESPGGSVAPGYGMGHMMGMGHGMMMGPGHGMMMGPSRGMMSRGHGMMGPGYGMMNQGYGMGPCAASAESAENPELTADHVRTHLEHRLAWQGNPRLNVGTVKEVDDDKIIAEIVTQDGVLVDKLEFDSHTWQVRRIN